MKKTIIPKNYGPLKPWSDEDAEATVSRIIEAVGKEPQAVVSALYYLEDGTPRPTKIPGRLYLRQHLQTAVASYRLKAYEQLEPSITQLANPLTSVQKAASRIVAALKLKMSEGDLRNSVDPPELFALLKAEASSTAEQIGGFPHYPPTDWSGGTREWFADYQLRDVLQSVLYLEQWAKSANHHLKSKPLRRRAERNRGDTAAKGFIGDLFGFWVACFKEVPKVSFLSKNGEPSGPFFRFVRTAFECAKIEFSSDIALGVKIRDLLHGTPHGKAKRRAQRKAG